MAKKLHQILYKGKRDPEVFIVAFVMEIFLNSCFVEGSIFEAEVSYSTILLSGL